MKKNKTPQMDGLPWFRMWKVFATDFKVQSMSEEMQRRLVMLFCLRCGNVTETLQDEEIMCFMRISRQEFDEMKHLFLAKGFIDNKFKVMNWDKRQYASDLSTQRVRKHRQKLAVRSVEFDETFQ